MFYDRFNELCLKSKKLPSVVADEIGISRATVTAWKKSGYAPRKSTVEKISEYFGVSADYILGVSEEENPVKASISDEDIKFALFGGDTEITDEMYEEVKRFAEFVKNKNKDNA